MDALLLQAAGGNSDGLGLNIVYDDTAKSQQQQNQTATTSALLTKKKKPTKRKSKYEKRREKSRQAKAAAQGLLVQPSQQQQHQQQEQKDGVETTEQQHSSLTSTENLTEEFPQQDREKLTKTSPIHHDDNNHAKVEEEDSVIQQTPESDQPLDDEQEELPDDNNDIVENEAISRKVHRGIDLENVEQRARYMAEFHARPLEMDRRSGASSNIRPSCESSHIFQNDDDDDDDDHDESNNEVLEKSTTGTTTVATSGSTQTSSNNPWKKCRIHERLVSTLTDTMNMERPTVIQSRAISSLVNNAKKRQNLFIQSETGSGKTLAYLIPILQSLAVDDTTGDLKRVDRQLGGTRCLILCPTRELASQTAMTADAVCRAAFNWLVPGCLSGGEKRKSEKARIRKGITILVATPGRLLDHLQKTESLLMALKGKLEWLVMDEADRLLDMGLGHQAEQIIQHIRANQPKSGVKRDGVTWRSILVSATVTNRVKELSKTMLGGEDWIWARASKSKRDVSQDALQNNDGDDDKDASGGLHLDDSTPRQLTQLHMTVSAKLRLVTLIAFLVERVKQNERTVVFMSTCDGVDYHHALFAAMNCILQTKTEDEEQASGIFGDACPVFKLHGNVPHAERHTILQQFSKGVGQRNNPKKKASLLLATDVAARGLNLPGVDWIVQYDPPCEVADYIHRAGRAARAGRAGHSLLFLLPSEQQFLDVLQVKGLTNMTALSLASTLNSAADICKDVAVDGNKRSGGGNGGGRRSRSGEAFCSELQHRLEELVIEDDIRFKEAHKEKLKKSRAKRTAKKQVVYGELLEKARNAFLSYVRAYPTKEKAVRHIFSARAIHLGHVARSFALKEQPKKFVSKAHTHSKRPAEKDAQDNNGKRNFALAFDASALVKTSFTKPDDKKTNEDRGNPKRAKSLLLARAAKLQDGGMDAF